MPSETRFACLILCIICLAGCAGWRSPQTDPRHSSDLVFKNGDVYTVDGVRSWADAVAVRGDEIVYVGSDAGVDAFIGRDTRVVDLNGKMMLPGFQDVWVNTKALNVMGVTKETPDPHGGRIDRDEETGEPIGVFQKDAAIQMAWEETPYTGDEIERGLRYSVEYLNSLGITSIQDAIVKIEGNDPYSSLEAYRRVNESGDLTLRSVLALFWDVNKGVEQVAKLVEARDSNSQGVVRATSVKIWLDGVMETKTAALLEPYLDGGNTAPYMNQRDLNHAVAQLDREGFQVHVHGIGDAATRFALNAFEYTREKNGIRDSRHHVCHLELIDPADIPRFRELDVIANFQPLWALPDDYITKMTVPQIGPERSRWLYPIGSVLEAGGMIAFGSDWYVTTPNPFPQIETAVTRRDAFGEVEGVLEPEERISLHDAIAAFTINAAFVNFQDETNGSIEVGKLADLIVVDRNLFSIDTQEISEANVELTLFGGQVVHGELNSLAR